MKDVSIIIVNWNVQDEIAECLHSLSLVEDVDMEVIVVDNASSDHSIDMIQYHFPWVKLIANQDNKGFAKACNQGIQMSEGEFVLLLNPDTTVPKHALRELVDFAHARPNAGVIGPKICNPDGSTQPSVRKFPGLWDQTLIQLKLHHINKNAKSVRDYLMMDFNYAEERVVDQVMGAAFLIPRSVIEAHGGLDERYFVWYEEVDFCLKIQQAGRDVIFFPDTFFIHKQGQSFFQLVSSHRQRMMNESLKKYMRKNHGRIYGAWFTILHPISMALSYITQLAKIRPKAL